MQQRANPIVPRILFVALLVSQGIYLAIPSAGVAEGPPAMLPAILGAVAVTQGLGALLFFRIAGVSKIQSGALDPTTNEGMGQLFVVLILSWVLTEAIAIFGLVLRFLGAPFWQGGLFALGAFVLMAAMNPWQSGLVAPMSSAERGRDSTPIA